MNKEFGQEKREKNNKTKRELENLKSSPLWLRKNAFQLPNAS